MKKYFFIKLLVVCIFMVVSYMICDLTKYYIAPVKYENDEIRVIIDEFEVTKNLPDSALIIDDKIMLSFDTIEKYFDEYIYFDEKYETVIVTSDVDILKMKLDEEILNLNGEQIKIDTSVKRISGDIYIPIEKLEEIYNISVEHNEKIIITTSDVFYKKIKMERKDKINLHEKELSLVTGKLNKGDVLYVFGETKESGYIRARNEVGDIGYVKVDDIKGEEIYINRLNDNKKQASKKINLTWEYAENYTPNRNNEEKIKGLDIISPTWIYMKNESGDIKYNTISQDYINWANSKEYSLWPIVKNDGMGLEKTSALVTDMYAREKFINNVIEVAKKYNFDGINIDFEYMKMEDRAEYSEFVREFSAALRKNGFISSVDVNVPDGSANWSLCYDHKALADNVDYLILMAYDQYGQAKDGPVASLSWVETNINKLIDREKIDNSKIVLGVPFYSKYRKNKITMSGDQEIQTNISSSTLSMSKAKEYLNSEKYKNSATWIDSLGQYYIEYRNQNTVERIWIEDENALKEKAKLVNKYDLAGIASWRWGFETKDAWKEINEALNK